ncbi:MAG: GAF domain-containing protein [Solirubrobacteraceae bacterium]|nr:GAF domain-containing protein [Solirubrobacteraceae bacterium]
MSISETAQSDVVDLIVGLLGEVDEEDFRLAPRSEYYSRLCQAVCQLVGMDRAILFLDDDVRRVVRPMGSHGFDGALVQSINAPLGGAGLVRRALGTDQVVILSAPFGEDELPSEYVRAFGLTTVACTPLTAGGTWKGVIISDRGGRPFELTAAERDRLWSLGKAAALAATARVATRQQLLNQQLSERLALARELHDSVIQRLFGITALLRSGDALDAAARERCAEEAERAMHELREVIERPLVAPPDLDDTQLTLAQELERLAARPGETPLKVTWQDGCEVPPVYEPLLQHVLHEALRNADKHAEATLVEVDLRCSDDALHMTIVNDGVRPGERPGGAGVGLRLCAMEALRDGGALEFGSKGGDRWRVRLTLPLP